MDPRALLRPGLLADRVVALGGGSALGPELAGLGATTAALPTTLDEDDAAAHARATLAAHRRLDVLLHDLRPQFASGTAGHDGLRAALDVAWVTIRAVANAAWIGDEHAARAGRVHLIAPPPAPAAPAAAAPGQVAPAAAAPGQVAPAAAAPPAPGDAAAVRAAAENLARTLSIEWARHGIRTVAILPGETTGDAALASVAACLASPAGDYFSGCVLALDGLAVVPAPV
jgi:NAD(P)-dependent dehydrogenase (short-subunit alcohol dehydrogenase family)